MDDEKLCESDERCIATQTISNSEEFVDGNNNGEDGEEGDRSNEAVLIAFDHFKTTPFDRYVIFIFQHSINFQTNSTQLIAFSHR